jgi:hypothetical protein
MRTTDAFAHPTGVPGSDRDDRTSADPADPAATVELALDDLDAARDRTGEATERPARRTP